MKKIISILLTIVFVINFIPLQRIHGNEVEKKRYIVKYKDVEGNSEVLKVSDSVYAMNTFSQLSAATVSTNVYSVDKLAENTYVLELSNEELSNLLTEGNIEFVEPDSSMSLSDVHEVSHNQLSWGLKAVAGSRTNLGTNPGKGINVAILDTGVSPHEEYSIMGGVSFVDGEMDYLDGNGHGTQVTGIIAAKHDEKGVDGMSPQSNIYAVKVLNTSGEGYYSDVIKGIDWAIENKMNIITMSFGGNDYSQLLHNTIKKATDQGILVLASAGNNGQGSETETYPALFPEVISVGAVNEQFYRPNFSSTGSQLDLVAPGTNIYTTDINNKFSSKSGTSMAVPFVAGAASVLWSIHPDYSAEDIKHLLLSTATPLGETHDYGSGIVNLLKALGISNDAISPEFPVQEVPIVDPDPSTGTYGEVGISSVKTGDGQIIMAGDAVSVSVKLSASKATISVGVFAPDGITKIASNSFYNKNAGDIVTFTWSSLKTNAVGTYKIKFYYNNTDPEDLFAIHVTPYLQTPTVVKGTVTSSSAVISWNAVPNATGYQITYFNKEVTVSSGQTSLTITGLNPNTIYTVYVKAKNSSNLFGNSGSVDILTLKNEKPKIPVISEAVPSGTKIELAWSNVDTAISYDLYLDNVYLTNVRNVTRYTFNNLQVDRSYGVGVAARNETGASDIATKTVFTNDDFTSATVLYSSINSSIDNITDIDYFKFVPPANGTYYFESSANFDLDADVYDKNFEIINSGTDISASNLNFYFGQELLANQVYYLVVHSVGNSMGNYNITVAPQSDDYIGNNNVISVGSLSGKINYPEDTDTFKFIPNSSGVYSFSSTGNLDTEATLFNSSFVELASNDDAILESSAGFNIEYNLVAGQTYYLSVGSPTFERGEYNLITAKGPKPVSAPTITLSKAIENNIFLEWNGDNTSQISGYKIFRNGIEVGNTSYTSFYDANLAENQSYSYTIQAYSGNNVSSMSLPLNVKTEFIIPTPLAPIITLSNTQWSNKNITFNIKKGEDIERDRLYYKVGEGNSWTSYYGGEITLSNEGSYNLYAKTLNVFDSANYTEALVRIDKTAPNIPSDLSINFNTSTNGSLSWTCSDNVGIAYYNIYVTDGGVKKLISSTSNTTLTITVPLSATSLAVEAHDFAENISEASIVAPDRIPPSDPYISGYETLSFSQTRFTLNASDNVAISHYEVNINQGKLKQVSKDTYIITNTASKPDTGLLTYVYVTAVDTSGNRSNTVTLKVYVGAKGGIT